MATNTDQEKRFFDLTAQAIALVNQGKRTPQEVVWLNDQLQQFKQRSILLVDEELNLVVPDPLADVRSETLDVSKGWDSIAMFDIVVRRLKRLKLYRKDLLYCASDWGRIRNLGFENEWSLLGEDDPENEPHIECSTEAEIRDPRGERNMAAEVCQFENPALIVFLPDKLQEGAGEYRYDPLPDVPLRDAATIVFRITSKEFYS